MTDQALVDTVRRSQLAIELSDVQMRALADSLASRDLEPAEILVAEEPLTIICTLSSTARLAW